MNSNIFSNRKIWYLRNIMDIIYERTVASGLSLRGFYIRESVIKVDKP